MKGVSSVLMKYKEALVGIYCFNNLFVEVYLTIMRCYTNNYFLITNILYHMLLFSYYIKLLSTLLIFK